jgi:hypothetical protein
VVGRPCDQQQDFAPREEQNGEVLAFIIRDTSRASVPRTSSPPDSSSRGQWTVSFVSPPPLA